jgi:hypothetical protein
MLPEYVVLRGCLKWNRPRLFNFLTATLYPNMAVTTTAAIYPLAAGKITGIQNRVTLYGTDH